MIDYKQLSLFDEYQEDQSDDSLVEEKDGYALYQEESKQEGVYDYRVFDAYGVAVAKWGSTLDCLSMKKSEYDRSSVRQVFVKVIAQEKEKIRKAEADKAAKERAAAAAAQKAARDKAQKTARYADDDDISWYRGSSSTSSYRSSGYSSYSNYDGGYNYGGYSSYYAPKPKSKGFLDKLNKSNTLVVHCEDRSTDMLAQIYEGKGWDVLRDGNIDPNELHQLLESHDRIVCLGHGTGSGLINKQGSGSVIGADEAPYLKDKKLFVIWCNADAYFTKHNIGNGQFITGNMPSEVWECRAAGCGEISAQLMLENITYWSKLCADVVERALGGDAQGAVDYVRDKYIAKYGDHPVTIYNAERTKVQGKPMEDLSDRYWGPEELLHPAKPSYPTYNHSLVTSTKPTNTVAAPDDADDEDEDDAEELNADYTIDELQEYADEISGLYQLNPSVEDFDGDLDAMISYIEEVEGLLEDNPDLRDIVYWTDVEDAHRAGIKVVTGDMEEHYFELDDGELRSW